MLMHAHKIFGMEWQGILDLIFVGISTSTSAITIIAIVMLPLEFAFLVDVDVPSSPLLHPSHQQRSSFPPNWIEVASDST
jgi:hypothetical protein